MSDSVHDTGPCGPCSPPSPPAIATLPGTGEASDIKIEPARNGGDRSSHHARTAIL